MTLPPGNPMTRVLSTLLILEVIVFGLAIPGMIQVSGRSVGVSLAAAGGAILLALLAASLLRRGAAGFLLGHLTQVVGVLLGLLTPYQYAVGGLFAILWVVSFVLGKRLDAAAAARG